MHPEGNSNPEVNKEQRLESMMRPLQQLVVTETFRFVGNESKTPYYVTVQWSEPREDTTGYSWQQFSGTGRLNNNFLEWAANHYDHWLDQAHVPLKVVKVEYLPNNPPKELIW